MFDRQEMPVQNSKSSKIKINKGIERIEFNC